MFYSKMEGIRPRRVAMGLSIGEAADRLGVTRQAWSNWERGVAIPFSGILPDLARVLKCSIEELYEEAKPSQSALPTAPPEGEPGAEGK